MCALSLSLDVLLIYFSSYVMCMHGPPCVHEVDVGIWISMRDNSTTPCMALTWSRCCQITSPVSDLHGFSSPAQPAVLKIDVSHNYSRGQRPLCPRQLAPLTFHGHSPTALSNAATTTTSARLRSRYRRHRQVDTTHTSSDRHVSNLASTATSQARHVDPQKLSVICNYIFLLLLYIFGDHLGLRDLCRLLPLRHARGLGVADLDTLGDLGLPI
jgi:hypothetical protein